MKNVLQKLSIVALGLATIALAQPASAGMLTQTVTFSAPGSPTNPLAAPTTVNTSQFSLFNSSLGTLTDVILVLTQTATVSSSVNNQNANVNNDTYSIYSYDSVIATGLDGKLQGSSVTSNVASGTIFASEFLTRLGEVSNITASSHAVSANDPTKYIGNGTTSLSVSGTFTTLGTQTGGDMNQFLTFGSAASFYGTVAITYVYTPNGVPEPASFAMLGVGLGSIALVRRVRRRNRLRTA